MNDDLQKDAPVELIARREKQLAAEALWEQRLRETLTEFPVDPFGKRVIVMQRRAEHMTKSGILLPQSANAPLSGWVVAVPLRHEKRWWSNVWVRGRYLVVPESGIRVQIGDEVLFPDHASHRITVMVGRDGEEQHDQEFLVIDVHDLHGVVRGGHVGSVAEVVPGMEKDTFLEGRDVPRG